MLVPAQIVSLGEIVAVTTGKLFTNTVKINGAAVQVPEEPFTVYVVDVPEGVADILVPLLPLMLPELEAQE